MALKIKKNIFRIGKLYLKSKNDKPKKKKGLDTEISKNYFGQDFREERIQKYNRIPVGISVKRRLQQITYINLINNWPKILVY